MNKKTIGFLALLAAGILTLQSSMFAESIEGKVLSVDKSTYSLRVEQTAATEGADHNNFSEIDITVSPAATFKGVSSLGGLKRGDMVKVDFGEGQNYDSRTAQTVTRL